MRQSVTAISAVIVILFTVTSESASAYFRCRDEKSLTVCQPEDLLTSGPKDRIKQSRILFETNNCLVGDPHRDSPIGPQHHMRADSDDCGRGFRLNAATRSDRRRPPVPTKAAGVWLPA